MRADKHHECGRRIDEIYDKVCIWKNTSVTPSQFELSKVSEDYLKILDKYENHTHLDYLTFKADMVDQYKEIKNPKQFWIKIKFRFYAQTIGLYIIAILSPLILFII